MPDPFYANPEWRALRAAVLRRDGCRCAVPGCASRATHADHVTPRALGGADALHNLRSLCPHHHNTRRKGGKRGAAGTDAQGWPLPPR